MTIEQMRGYTDRLAAQRRVIAVELQAHGRTSDADRPLRYELLADDLAALLDHLGLAQADVFGYSLGAGVAMQLAIRHPARIRRLVAMSVTYDSAGLHPELAAAVGDDDAVSQLRGSPYHRAYQDVAADPQLCLGVLMYLPDSRSAITELARYVAAGGLLCLAVRTSVSAVWRPAARQDWPAALEALHEGASARAQGGTCAISTKSARRPALTLILRRPRPAAH